jgi:hypothetical protein
MAISTNGTVLARVAGALYNTQMSNATYKEVAAMDPSALTDALYARDFSSATDATVATTLVTNLGLTSVAGLTNWVAAQLTAAGSHKGAKVVELLNGFAQLTADATYGAAATAFNTKVDASLALSQTDGNKGGTFADAGTVVVGGGTFALTTGTDVADNISASRGNLTSTFTFTNGNETVNASVGTLGDNDILLDNSTTDADVLTVSGGTGTFTSSNIETINLTTATAATLQLDNVTGVKNVNVTGTNTIAVDGFAAATLQPVIGVNNITKIVTLQPATLAGTTTDATAETLNVSVSGLSYGTTTATRSGITIDGKSGAGVDADGVLEVLNLASTGSTANDFALAFDSGDSVSKIAITGDQSVQIRAATADLTGTTIDATANTATVTLRVERNGDTTTATNAANWTGVDDIVLTDSDAATDAAVVSALASGAKVTLGTSFAGNSALTFQGATYTALKDSVSVVLDNVAATPAGVNITKLDVQNVKTLNLSSAGHAASTSTTGANVLDNLVGDFTTITITGDTSLEADLNIDATETATSTSARTVVVNASGMTGTAFVNFSDIAANSKVGYSITGTANKDTVTLNNTAGTVNGGAGNDVITGGDGNDSVNGGDGDDLINISYGTDVITGGAGNDTIDVDLTTGSATAQVSTLLNLNTTVTLATSDRIVVVIDGVTYTETYATGATNTIAAFVTNNAARILDAHGVTVASIDTDTDLRFTGKADGTSFSISSKIWDNSASAYVTQTATPSTSPVVVKDVSTTVTDFAVGDVLNTEGLTGLATGGYYEGASAGMTASTAYGAVVLTGASYASVAEASTAINVTSSATAAAVVFFLNSTLGKVQAYYDDDLGTDAVSGGNDSVLFTFDNITTLTGLASVFSADSIII